MSISRSDKEIAEEYRQQRQGSDGEKNGFAGLPLNEQLRWLDENHELLIELAFKEGCRSREEAESAIAKYKAQASAVGPIGAYDDINAILILKRVINEIEQACAELNFETPGAVVSGLLPQYGLEAGQKRVPWTNASILGFSTSFFPFFDLISTALAASLVVEGTKVNCDQSAVRAHIAARLDVVELWAKIVTAYAVHGWDVLRINFTLSDPELDARASLLRAMELFACGHEFAHHALQHDPTSTDLSSEEAREDEYAADHFARVISKHVGRRREPPLEHATSGVGGVIVLKSLELIVRVQTVLLTGVDCVPAVASHPTVSDRIHRFGEADAEEPADLQERFSMLRNHFVAIFDQLWWSIRPAIFESYKEGVRPLESRRTPPGGWLPR